MSKGKSGTSSRSSAIGTPSSLTSLLSPITILSLPVTTNPEQLTYDKTVTQEKLGDRRRYHPQYKSRPADAFNRGAARLHIGRTMQAVRFNVPNLVNICIRRKVRREVLHALNRTRVAGKGGARRRNFYSSVSC